MISSLVPRFNPRVFCCPFAGGSSAAFRSWMDFDQAIQVVGLDYPGRMMRDNDTMLRSVDAIATQLTNEIVDQTNGPFALFGVSLGALVALEIAYRLEDAGRSPACLILCACVAPERLSKQPKIVDNDDEVFFDRLCQRYGGPIATLADDPDARDIVLRYLKADIETFENYVFNERSPLKSKIVVASGRQDPTVSLSDILDWRNYSSEPVEFLTIEGGHLFAMEYSSLIAEQLRKNLIRKS